MSTSGSGGNVHPLRKKQATEGPSSETSPLQGARLSDTTISRRYGRRDYFLRRGLAIADMMSIGAAMALAFALSPSRPGLSGLLWTLPTLPAWVLLFRAYGLYERDVKRISHGALDDVPNLFHALLIGTLALWMWFRVVAEGSRLVLAEVVVFGLASMTLILLLRASTRRLVARGMGPERVVFLGEPTTLRELVRKIDSHPEYGLEPVGIVATDGVAMPPSLPVLGTLDSLDLRELEHRHAVERLIVAHDDVDDAVLLGVLQDCGTLSVKVSILPRYGDALGPSVEVDDIEGVTVLDLNPLVLSRSSRYFKRIMDVVGASVGLLASALPMVLIAIAIKFDSRGPIFFKQERIGRRGHHFNLIKFRTMIPDAEKRVDELLEHSEDPNWLKLKQDPRVNRVGKLLRLFSLDELPQLINVLKGEMSLVGPRPLIASEDEKVTGWSRTRLDLAPGITGLWQVLGRTNIPFEEMVKLDTLYVTNWSLWLDVKLLLRTIGIVLSRRGAN